MKANSDLHDLIQSLTKSEKRYFSLFAKRHVIGEENKYIKLFISIEKQKEYKESDLLSHLNNGRRTANFAAEKAYLKELILKSLKQFHEKNRVESVLFDRLIQIEIIYEKGLFAMGYKLILKAMDLAKAHEKYLIQAELLIWKVNYELKLNEVQFLSDNIQQAHLQVNHFLESISYMKSFFELFLINAQSGVANDPIAINTALKRFGHVVAKARPESSIGAYYYYAIQSLLALLQKDNQGMAFYFEKCVNLFKNSREFREDETNLYLKAVNNYILSLIEIDNLKAADAEIKSLETTLHKMTLTDQLRARAFIYISDTRLCILSKQFKWSQGYAVSKEIEKHIPEYEKYFEAGRKADLYFSLARVCFYANDYKKAYTHLNKVIRLREEKNMDPAMVSLAMLVQLLSMLEGKDLVLFGNKLIATRKYILKNPKVSFFLLFCDYISKAEKGFQTHKDRSTSQTLVQRMVAESQNDESLKRLAGYFDLVDWLVKSAGLRTS
jgi:tetratricopeptide (TPR) repeat protein